MQGAFVPPWDVSEEVAAKRRLFFDRRDRARRRRSAAAVHEMELELLELPVCEAYGLTSIWHGALLVPGGELMRRGKVFMDAFKERYVVMDGRTPKAWVRRREEKATSSLGTRISMWSNFYSRSTLKAQCPTIVHAGDPWTEERMRGEASVASAMIRWLTLHIFMDEMHQHRRDEKRTSRPALLVLLQGVGALAHTLFHRFFATKAMQSFDPVEVAVACTYLAAKVQEYRKSLEFMSRAALAIMGFRRANSSRDQFSVMVRGTAARIRKMERTLLYGVGFELYIVLPHTTLSQSIRALQPRLFKVQLSEVRQKLWRKITGFILLDSLSTSLCLQYPAPEITAVAVVLAAHLLDISGDVRRELAHGRQWFEEESLHPDDVAVISEQLLEAFCSRRVFPRAERLMEELRAAAQMASGAATSVPTSTSTSVTEPTPDSVTMTAAEVVAPSVSSVMNGDMYVAAMPRHTRSSVAAQEANFAASLQMRTSSEYSMDGAAPLGEGTYGVVRLGKCPRTGKNVALKKIKDTEKWEGSFPAPCAREIKLLQALHNVNIVNLQGIVCDAASLAGSAISLVFDFCQYDLTGLMHIAKAELTHDHMLCYTRQILAALKYAHDNCIMHRDMKPSNVMVSVEGPGKHVIKVADWGLGLYVDRKGRTNTLSVITPWYRAPEVFFKDRGYDYKVDMWSVGCVLAEMLRGGRPLFPGKDAEEQIPRMFRVLGRPTEETWQGWSLLEGAAPFLDFPATDLSEGAMRLRTEFPKGTPPGALQLLQRLLTCNPSRRWGAQESIQECAWFKEKGRSFQCSMCPCSHNNLGTFTVDRAYENNAKSAHSALVEQHNMAKRAKLERERRYADPGADATAAIFEDFLPATSSSVVRRARPGHGIIRKGKRPRQ
eukprot:g4967.t1